MSEIPNWIDLCLGLDRKSREQPINVAHLKLLIHIYDGKGSVETNELLPFFKNEKPTLISRLNTLLDKKLIIKLTGFNRGGNGNPNIYKVSELGEKIVLSILTLNSNNK